MERVRFIAFLALVAACSSGSDASGPVTLQIQFVQAGTTAGTPTTVLAVARTAAGDVAAGFAGRVTFTSTDPLAQLPDAYDLGPADGGQHLFEVEFRTAGPQTLAVFVAGASTSVAEIEVRAGPLAAFRFDIDPVQPGAEDLSFAVQAEVVPVDEFDNIAEFDAAQDPVTITAEPADGTLTGNVFGSGSRFDLVGRLVFSWNGSGDPMHRFRATSEAGVTGLSPLVEIATRVPVEGFARFEDANRDGAANAGDRLVVPFRRAVELDGLGADAFDLLIPGHRVGAGAILRAGPAAHEVTVVLGIDPVLQARQLADPTGVLINTATGVDLVAGTHSGLRDYLGLPAAASTSIDVVPGIVLAAEVNGGRATQSILCGDFDLDGDTDLLAVNRDEDSRLHFNDGDGGFSAPSRALLGSRGAYAAATGDIDNDGDLDVVFANAGANTVWLNDGGLRLVDSGQRLGDAQTFAVALHDIDLDGDLDLVAGNDGANRIWLNDSNGVFFDSGHRCGSTLTNALLVTDLDGDMRPDLVFGDGGVAVWRNDGEPGFTAVAAPLREPASALAAADIDRDGDTDIVAATQSGIFVYTNDGRGRLTPGAALPGSAGGQPLALVDFDSNGWIDVVTPARVWIRAADGTFQDSGLAVGEDGADDLAIVNLDLDGDPDLVFAHADGPSRIYESSLSGAYGAVDDLNVYQGGEPLNTRSLDMTAADFDGDGDLDLVSAVGTFGFRYERFVNYTPPGGPGRTQLLVNDGRGGFEQRFEILPNIDVAAIVAGDVDRDGRPDLVSCGIQGETVWLNDGTGGFVRGETIETTTGVCLALGDLDRDGDLDLVVGTKNGSGVRLGDGRGGFASAWKALSAEHARSIALGDIDLDGDVDIVVAHSGLANRIWINDGKGNFTDSGQALGANFTYQVRLADVDRDHDLDIVALNNTQPNYVWLNDGKGVFSDSGQRLGNTCTNAAVLLDLDCDGDLDMVEGNDSVADIIWRNDDGVFVHSGRTLPVGSTFALLAVDLDHDGDADFVQANWGFSATADGPNNDAIHFHK